MTMEDEYLFSAMTLPVVIGPIIEKVVHICLSLVYKACGCPYKLNIIHVVNILSVCMQIKVHNKLFFTWSMILNIVFI